MRQQGKSSRGLGFALGTLILVAAGESPAGGACGDGDYIQKFRRDPVRLYTAERGGEMQKVPRARLLGESPCGVPIDAVSGNGLRYRIQTDQGPRWVKKMQVRTTIKADYLGECVAVNPYGNTGIRGAGSCTR